MRIGIIGAGALGRALAVRFVAAGEEVLLSDSRGPGRRESWPTRSGRGWSRRP